MISPVTPQLLQALEEKKAALALRCIDAMYADPFWHARFAERGRRHAEEDAAFHLKYVSAALREQDLGVFRHYTVWLRGVLASRGMCSWHLSESFRQLTLALSEEGILYAEPAAQVLATGVRALAYVDGEAGELETHADVLRGCDGYRVEELVSFLLDGVARGDSNAFRSHVEFLDGRLATGQTERAALRATLAALEASCAGLPCVGAATKATQLLSSARLG